jgi:hypothetical protein
MIARHWYNIFVWYNSYGGHVHLRITPLGWVTLAVIVAAILISVAMQR